MNEFDPDTQIKICLIWAQNQDRVIGQNGKIPWHLPEDLKHFKKITEGSPVVMGRNTWESLPAKPLPGRDNIVVTSRELPEESSESSVAYGPGVWKADTLKEAIVIAKLTASREKVFVIGGAKLYQDMLPFADELFVTHVEAPDILGDTFAPEIPLKEFGNVTEPTYGVSEHGIRYSFAHYSRAAEKKLA